MAGIIGTATTGTVLIGAGTIGMETIGVGITGMEIIGVIPITTTERIQPIREEEARLIPLTLVVTEVITPEVPQITLETKAIVLAQETTQITEETPLLIQQEVLQTDSIEPVQHFREIKTIIVHLPEDQTRIALATKTTDLKDPTLQVQETTTIPDPTALAQIILGIPAAAVVVDHPVVAEEAEEDNNPLDPYLILTLN